MRALTRTLLGVLVAGVPTLAAGCGGDDGCKQQGSVLVCGDFGETLYTTDLVGGNIEWPPVAISEGRLILARGQELVQVGADGAVKPLTKLDSHLTAPSRDEQGNFYVMGGSFDSSVSTWQGGQLEGKPTWTQKLNGNPAGTPPSLGNDRVYAATSGGQGALHVLDRATGTVLRSRPGASPAAVMADESIRYLGKPMGTDGFGGPPLFARLVAEGPDGQVLWTHDEPQGLVDFAPGAHGETYVVTGGTHVLQRVSNDGKTEWTFTPPCNNCTVAAAPTVTEDEVYFPVWEERDQELIDPLYALDAKTGGVNWVYDGFYTKKTNFSANKLLAPGSSPVDSTRTLHHPAGRPVLAADGTLYVSTDGAVSALDRNGQVLGLAVYDANAGEVVSGGDRFMDSPNTWINPGVRPSPVLGQDGTLYVWDGSAITAYRTGRASGQAAWVAPFGGSDNAGRVPR